MHMVDDFDEAEARFDALFSPITFMPKSWSNLDKRWASLSRVGSDFVWELMEASTEPADAAAPLVKFRQRFGQHLHSFSWLFDGDEQRDLVNRLDSGGVVVVSPTGVQLGPETDDLPRVMFTHPKSTFGQIELMTKPAMGSNNDPYFQPGWSDRFWRDEQPLGILRTSHMTNLVGDYERAKTVFGDLLGGKIFYETSDSVAKRAYVFVGSQSVIELVEPQTTEGLLGEDFVRSGGLPHSVTFAVRDLAAAEQHVEKLGIGIAERSGETLTLDPNDCFGAIISMTTAAIPNDPRGIV
jgi:hypothetical protein